MEWVTTLAAEAGAALVNAVTTNVWQTARDGFARIFGRGDARRQELAMTRLDTTAAEIEQADGADIENVRRAQLEMWKIRLVDLLYEDPDVARALRALTDQITTGQTWTQVAESGAVIETNTAYAKGSESMAIGRMDNGTFVDKRRKYNIGSIQFGNGGLATLIVIAIVFLGSGAAGVIYSVTPPSLNLDEVRGTWSYHEQASGQYMDVILNVEVPTFTLTMEIYRVEPSGERIGIHIECNGIVTAEEDEVIFSIHFRSHQPIGDAANLTSECPDWFSGVLADSGKIIELSSPSGQPIRFQRS